MKKECVFLVVGLLLAGCDRERWEEFGPAKGGRLSAILVSPGNYQTLLVASPGGGVWRMPSASSWEEVTDGLDDFNVFDLQWDLLSNHEKIYAVTPSAVYSSTDFGSNWTQLPFASSAGTADFWIDNHPPGDPRPFAQMDLGGQTALFWARRCAGLWYSIGGQPFEHLWPFAGGSANPQNCILGLAADNVTKRLYISTMRASISLWEPANVFRTDTTNCSWSATTICNEWGTASDGFPASARVATLTWTGTQDELIAASEAEAGGAQTVVYRTINGQDWNSLGVLPGNSWDPRALISPSSGEFMVGTVVAYQKVPGVAPWLEFNVSAALASGGNMWEHPDVRSIYAQQHAQGGFVWTVTDGYQHSPGNTYANITRWDWTPGQALTNGNGITPVGIRAWQAFSLESVERQPSGGLGKLRTFLGLIDNGSGCTDDGGQSWSGGPGGIAGDIFAVVAAPSDPNRIYARSNDSQSLFRTDNAVDATTCSEVTWDEQAVTGDPETPALWNANSASIHPTDPDRVVFAGTSSMSASSNGGFNFEPLPSLPDGVQSVSVTLSELPEGEEIFMGSYRRGAFVLPPGATEWQPFGLNDPSPEAVFDITFSGEGSDRIFFLATTDGLYRRAPSDTDWVRVFGQDLMSISDVEVDRECPDRVFASFGYASSLGQDTGGVAKSIDAGATWEITTTGMGIEKTPVSSVKVRRALTIPVVMASSYGRGAWSALEEACTEG